LVFAENKVTHFDGAVHGGDNSKFILNGDAWVTFTRNIAEHGGAVSIFHSTLLLAENSTTYFNNNTAKMSGGAIHLVNGFTMTFNNASNTAFDSNYAN